MQAHPLAWPNGWPRTSEKADDGRFNTVKQGRTTDGRLFHYRATATFAVARDRLYEELERLGASSVVISSNHPTDVRGIPVESKRVVGDEGVAVYFMMDGQPYVIACDRYVSAAGNMSSIRKAIEAMRQLERHGGGVMMKRAFSGFAALPPPKTCWEILGIAKTRDADAIRAAFNRRAKTAHPDAGGSPAAFSELVEARRAALEEGAA